jgi:hypothetical protein
MKSYSSLIVFTFFFAATSAGQSSAVLIGGRSTAMGNTSASLKDSWALYNNPAGSAKLRGISFNFTCDKYPELAGADRVAALAVFHLGAGTFSAGAFRFGDRLYSESLLSAGYSNSLGLASMGVRVDFIQYRAEGFDPAIAFGVTIGTIADITDQLSLGCYVSNLNQPKLPDGQPLPLRMATGFAFRPTEKVIVCGEIEKEVEFDPSFKAGVEIAPLKKVKLRSGFNLYPNAAFAGLGLEPWGVCIDYSLAWRSAHGVAHQASLSFRSKSKKAQRK